MTIQTKGALDYLSRVERQVDFASARALTWTARDAARELTEDLPEIFDKPTPFTQRGIAALPATKRTQTAWVIVKDVQAGYLARQQTGGTRKPEPGSPILIPKKQRVNKYGNIARGAIGRALAKENTFFASGKDARTRHLPPGVYQRPKRGKRRRGGKGNLGVLKLLAALEDRAQYRPRFQMDERVGRSVLRHFPARFNESLELALKSAK